MTQPASKQGGGKPRTAITPTREENFPEWYQSVIKAADLSENSAVRGCMVIKPYGYALWENIQRTLDDLIKAEGVSNAYFPLLIPLSFIAREAEHVEGFAKECAVVTHHRLEKDGQGGLVPAASAALEEPFIIRPTSETIIGDSMARWIQSYRDLPLKLNQWCNVMRWEMRTRMFLRTSEFIWQEGHNAFANAQEADADARRMLEVYRDLYENHLAIAGIPGEKTADERFPGAVQSFTIEAMMQDGKALQACTSHNLGQNFARSCDIRFQGEDGQSHLAHTTSWGFSTRSIGGLIMSHADDDGMIMPPRVAPQQVAIIPILRDEAGRGPVIEYCRGLAGQLRAQGVRVQLDESDARTPDKMWGSIKKGVPLRVEIGQREMEEGVVTCTRRDLGKASKQTLPSGEFVQTARAMLDTMQADLLARSRAFTRSNTHEVRDAKALRDLFEAGTQGFARLPAALLSDQETRGGFDAHSLTPRCVPFDDGGRSVIVGKSY